MCARCNGQMVRDLHDEKTCLNCGWVQYATPPLPYVRTMEAQSGKGRQEAARKDMRGGDYA